VNIARLAAMADASDWTGRRSMPQVSITEALAVWHRPPKTTRRGHSAKAS